MGVYEVKAVFYITGECVWGLPLYGTVLCRLDTVPRICGSALGDKRGTRCSVTPTAAHRSCLRSASSCGGTEYIHSGIEEGGDVCDVLHVVAVMEGISQVCAILIYHSIDGLYADDVLLPDIYVGACRRSGAGSMRNVRLNIHYLVLSARAMHPGLLSNSCP